MTLIKKTLKISFQGAFGDSIDSFFALSTCNRTEVYIYGSLSDATNIAQQTLEFFGSGDSLNDDLYFF
jgi:glutamyl-tRNA reductase